MNPVWRVWLASGLYAAAFAALDTDRYTTYHSGADLGLFAQTISSAFHGFSNTVEGGSHFTFHFSPLLYVFAPALWLFKSPLALLWVQAFAAALVAPPLYLIASKRVPASLAFGVALVGLLYPPLAGVAFSDFHENALVPAVTLWLIWAVDARRFGWATALFATALAIKEDQAPILAFASACAIWYFTRKREPLGLRFALAGLAACAIVFAGYFTVVRPLAGAKNLWEPLHFYAGSPPPHRGVGREVLERSTYLLEAFVPLCFICFASPAIVLALPGFSELFLSRDPVLYTMGQHYAAVWIPYVLAAFALGVARLYRTHPLRARNFARASAILCALNLVFLSPTHWSHYLSWRTAHDARLDAILAKLPSDAHVGTHDEIFAHVGLDPNASLGLGHSPQLVLVDETKSDSYWVKRLGPRLADPENGYRLAWRDDGIALYERAENRANGPPASRRNNGADARR